MQDQPFQHPINNQTAVVAVDIVLFTLLDDSTRKRQLHTLLARRRYEPFLDRWQLPGAIVHTDETLDAAAARELASIGVQDVYLEQLYTFGLPDRDPRARVISVAYFALLRSDQQERLNLDSRLDLRWFALSDTPQPLAFDHGAILSAAVDRLRSKLEYTTLAFQLLPEVFTLPDLKLTYETILGEELDRGNFYRKIKEAGLLEAVGRWRESGGRPAALYRFRNDRPEGDFVFRWREARIRTERKTQPRDR